MKVLIACEFSGIVREAFSKRGHNAWSCDLLDTEIKGQHIKGDCRDILNDGWDLMIAHPPCTFLCNSGVRWLYTGGRGNVRDETRWIKMSEACEFFKLLLAAPIERIAVENPIMHKHAMHLIKQNCNQTIQPWMFGTAETKATCFWLKGLLPLKPTKMVSKFINPRVHLASPSLDRWKERSRTLPNIADAMAEQWGIA